MSSNSINTKTSSIENFSQKLLTNAEDYDKKNPALDVAHNAQKNQKLNGSPATAKNIPAATEETENFLNAAITNPQKALKENEAVTSDSALQSIDASIQQSKSSAHPHLQSFKKIIYLLRTYSSISNLKNNKYFQISTITDDKNNPLTGKLLDGEVIIETIEAQIIASFKNGVWLKSKPTSITLKDGNVKYLKPEFIHAFIPVNEEIKSKFFCAQNNERLLTEMYMNFKHLDSDESFNITVSSLRTCLKDKKPLLDKYYLVRDLNSKNSPFKLIHKDKYDNTIHEMPVMNQLWFKYGLTLNTINKEIKKLSDGKARIFQIKEGYLLPGQIAYILEGCLYLAGGSFVGLMTLGAGVGFAAAMIEPLALFLGIVAVAAISFSILMLVIALLILPIYLISLFGYCGNKYI